MSSAPRSAPVHYGVAALSVALAIVVRLLVTTTLGPTVFLLFFAAVTVSAWYGGLGPGLFATVLAMIVGGWFTPARPVADGPEPFALARLIAFGLEAGLISVLCGTLHGARRRALDAQRRGEEAQLETAVALERTRVGAAVQDELRSRLAAVVEGSGDAIITVDLQGRIVSWNPGAERMFGHAAAEAIGRPVDLIAQGSSADEPRLLVQLVLRGERVGPIEVVRVAKDGRPVEVSLAASPLRDVEGHVTGGAAIFRDISARRRDEEEIRRLNRDLERRVSERTAELETANHELEAFTYSVSHDLRAPLRGLDGFSRILLQDHAAQLDGEAQRYLALVRDNAQRMGALIDDLLRLSRLTSQPLERRRVDVEELVREVLASLEREWEGRRIEFHIGPLPPCDADRGLLKQVFVNLLSNAIKYTRPRDPAHIAIEAEEDPAATGAPVYVVRDDGVGFEMRYAGKMFGVFQRFHRAEEYEGTGAGLAIAHRIVGRHGGRIWAESAPDDGATFRFTVPAAG
jgi:PAS domain S-box-containing protein